MSQANAELSKSETELNRASPGAVNLII